MGGFDGEELLYANWTLWQQNPETLEWFAVDGPKPMEPSRKATYEQRLMFIEPPIVCMYGGKRMGFHRAKPLIQSQADLNLSHFQKKSDVDNIERLATTPVLTMTGGEATRHRLGGWRSALIE